MIISNTENSKIYFYLKCIIFFLFVYSIIEKIILYAKFGSLYTDEDQCVLWLAADELMHGNFREPCFFGQAYNSCLEGWLSIPFLLMGLNYHQAIPLTTILMSILPFLLLAYFHYSKQEYFTTVVIFFCLLIFSLNYKLISILPRGFITGVFCFGIGYYLLLRKSNYAFCFFVFFTSFGIAFNEMSIFLGLPVLLIYFKENYNRSFFYWQGMLGVIPALIYKSYSYYFYNVSNPKYNYFVKPKFEWKFEFLENAMTHLDAWFFNNFTVIFILFIILGSLLLYKKLHFKLLVMLVTFTAIIASLGLERMQEGVDSIMFNKSRLFVFIPLLFSVLFSVTLPLVKISAIRQLIMSLFLFSFIIIHCSFQQVLLNEKIQKEISNPNKIVSFLPVTDVYKISSKYINLCIATKNDIIMYDFLKKEDFILYNTIYILSKNKIKTILPTYDRRFWIYSKLLNSKPSKVLVSGNFGDRYNRETLKSYNRKIVLQEDYWIVEYFLTKNIKNTCVEDFNLPLRLH